MSNRRSLGTWLEKLESRRMLAVTPGVIPAPTGSLSGRVVYLNGGHGFAADGAIWNTGRGNNNGVVEDFGNQDQLQPFADYILAAGGTVAALRPIGYQPREVIVDNTAASYSGAWSNSTNARYFGNPGDVPYRFASTNSNETATATYSPNIQAAGFYPVYAWTLDGTDRSNQLYRINHAGGSQEIRVDHRKVGKGWVYLGTYYFDAGTGGNVQISNQTDGSGGSVVIADAIRFGNGMGDINRGSGTSGQSREDEASLYWIERMIGQGDSFSNYRTSSDDESSNVGTAPRYAAAMNRSAFGQSLFLSFHSNAGGGRGAVGLTNADGGTGNTPNQTAWADLIGREITKDLVAQNGQFEFNWFDRTNFVYDEPSFDYGEISSAATGNEFDATIAEVAYHDNATDAALLLDPKVRDAIGKASYQSIVKYFAQFGGAAASQAPGVATNVRTSLDSDGNLTLSWTAPAVNLYNGDAATGYAIDVSRNGYAFGSLATVGNVTSYTIPASELDANSYYFRVRSLSAGGSSKPSGVVGAKGRGDGGPKVLVVNGFTRLGRSQDPIQRTPLSYDPPMPAPTANTPTNPRVRARFSNSSDYVAQVGAAIDAYTSLPVGFEMVQKAQFAALNLAAYDAIIWLAGEQSSVDQSFTAAEQSAVAGYLSGGGRLFVSGSEIGYDLVGVNGNSALYANTFKASYVSDDSGTYNAGGGAGSIFEGLSLSFDNGQQFYDVDYPDRIGAGGGSTVALNYIGGLGGGAATQFASGRTKVVNLAFPFETITTAANRAAVMGRVLDYFDLLVRGDMNNDGVVNNADIAAFVQGLTDANGFRAAFGYAPTLRGDVNLDGTFNNADIAAFVAKLTGARPTPAAAVAKGSGPAEGSRAIRLLDDPKDDRELPRFTRI